MIDATLKDLLCYFLRYLMLRSNRFSFHSANLLKHLEVIVSSILSCLKYYFEIMDYEKARKNEKKELWSKIMGKTASRFSVPKGWTTLQRSAKKLSDRERNKGAEEEKQGQNWYSSRFLAAFSTQDIIVPPRYNDFLHANKSQKCCLKSSNTHKGCKIETTSQK